MPVFLAPSTTVVRVTSNLSIATLTRTMTLPSTPAMQPDRIDHPSPAMEAIESVDKMLTTMEGSSFEEIMKERNRVSTRSVQLFLCIFK